MADCEQAPTTPDRHYAVEILQDVLLPLDRDAASGSSCSCALRRIAHCRWLEGFRFIEPNFQPVFLGLVLKGRGQQFDEAGNCRILAPGTLMVCGGRRLRAQRVIDPEGLEVLFMVTQSDATLSFALANLPLLPVALSTPRAHEFEELLRILLREGARMGRHAIEICNTLAKAVLLLAGEACLDNEAKIPRREQLFLQARRHIQANLHQPLTTSSVAGSLHISRAYLARIFAEFAREAPLAYIQRQRMAMAAEKLQNSAETVQEVAYAMGFDDPLAFSRSFRRVMGEPPSRFLR